MIEIIAKLFRFEFADGLVWGFAAGVMATLAAGWCLRQPAEGQTDLPTTEEIFILEDEDE